MRTAVDTSLLLDVWTNDNAHADRLLARDRGYYRDYFKGLRPIEP